MERDGTRQDGKRVSYEGPEEGEKSGYEFYKNRDKTVLFDLFIQKSLVQKLGLSAYLKECEFFPDGGWGS